MLRATCFIFFLTMAFDSISQQYIVYAANDAKHYQVILLKHALSYFPEKNYHLKAFDSSIPKPRAFTLMAQNKGIDVMNATATKARAAQLLPIHFPILKGLNGLRIPIINRATPALFAEINTLKKLKQLNLVLFHTWTDVEIMQSNNIPVVKGTVISGLFEMIDKNRVDYFPQSILDIERDINRYKHLNLMIDPYISIKYPSAYYFYVRKGNHALANDILQGLEKALADGSFDKLFYQYYGDILKRFNYEKRRVFELNNPILLDSLQRDRKELWLQ